MKMAAGPAALIVVSCLLLAHAVQAQRTTVAPADAESEFLIIDATTGRLLTSRWQDAERSISPGSLVKPFTALAYASTHGFTYPVVTCLGSAGRCWLPSGHGRIGIADAVAESCNDYFHHLAGSIAPDAFVAMLRRFGLGGGVHTATADMMVGLGEELKVPPLALARAYAELASRAEEPGVAPVLQGMRMSASGGTGRGVGAANHLADALVKTGTSPCAHAPRATADGHAVVIYPADRPRIVLLVHAHGRTGAATAVLAGEILAHAPEAR